MGLAGAARDRGDQRAALVAQALAGLVARLRLGRRERGEGRRRRGWGSRVGEQLQRLAGLGGLQLFADATASPAPSPAFAAFTTTAAPPESRHDHRERLRDERRTLVAAVARRTGEAHRAIHARVNRATGASSVTAASAEQLERGNRLLERKLG